MSELYDKALKESSELDVEYETVEHPLHYNSHPSGVECIDIIEHFSFNVGSAMKYLWRAGLKGDDSLEDLKKAEFYASREVERLMRLQDDLSRDSEIVRLQRQLENLLSKASPEECTSEDSE